MVSGNAFQTVCLPVSQQLYPPGHTLYCTISVPLVTIVTFPVFAALIANIRPAIPEPITRKSFLFFISEYLTWLTIYKYLSQRDESK